MKAGDKVYIKSDTYKAYGVNCGDDGIVHYIDGAYISVAFSSMTLLVLGSELDLDHDEQPVMSQRFNQGKVQTREIDPAFILGIGEVLTKSRAKYDHFNWCKPTKLSTPYESMMRHILAFQSGENFDKETSSHHLLHAATNLMFMYYHIQNNPEESDDRFFKNTKTSDTP